MQGGEDGDLERIDGKGARRDLAHLAVDILSEVENILVIAVRTDAVGLVVDLDSDGLFGHMVSGRPPRRHRRRSWSWRRALPRPLAGWNHALRAKLRSSPPFPCSLPRSATHFA